MRSRPIFRKVDRALAQAGLDPKNLGDVGKLSRNIPAARYTEIEKKIRVLAADLKEKGCLEELDTPQGEVGDWTDMLFNGTTPGLVEDRHVVLFIVVYTLFMTSQE